MNVIRHTPVMIDFPGTSMAKKLHTPMRTVRMDQGLHDAITAFGKQSGIGNFSAAVRFACQTFLREHGNIGPFVTPENPRRPSGQTHATGR